MASTRLRFLPVATVIAIGIAGCIVGGAFLFLGEGDESSSGEPLISQKESGAASPSPAAGELDGAKKAIETEPFAERRPEEDGPAGIRLEVVEKEGGRPVPGASITVEDTEAWMAASTQYREAGEKPPKNLCDRFTTNLTSDAEGAIELPAFAGRLRVEGRHGSLWGRLWVRGPSEGPIVLELTRDLELRVRVVDALDQPRGAVPVVMRRWDARRSRFRQSSRIKTDADGLAVLHHVQLRLAESDDWEVTLGFPMLAPPAIPVSAETSSGEELLLKMPEFGSLLISCVDQDGSSAMDTATLRLTAHAGHADQHPELWPPALETWADRNEEGAVVLPFVGLGVQFRATLTAHDRSRGLRPAVVIGAGPTEPGQTATMTVVQGEGRFPVVTGRFVRSDGRPLAAGHVCAIDRIEPDDGTNRSWQKVAVDESGHFRLVIRYPIPPGGTYLCELQELTADGSWMKNPPKVRIDLTPFGPPADHDIGDVVLDYGALLVSGRVLDQYGDPLEGAEVTIMERASAHGFGSCRGCTFAPTAKGGFQVHRERGRELPKNALRLYACHPLGLKGMDMHDFTAGDTGLTIVVPVGGGVLGSVKLEAGREMPALSANFHDSKGGWSSRAIPPDGKIEVSPLEPGCVTFDLTPRGADPTDPANVILRVSDIEIRAFEVSRDPRLQDIALPSWLKSLTLTVKDGDGEPLVGIDAYGEGGKRGRHMGRTNSEGEIRLLSRPAGLALELAAPGYRSLALSVISEDRSVVMRMGLQVQLGIEGLAPEDPLAERISLNLMPYVPKAPSSFGLMRHRLELQPVASVGKVRFELPSPGVYRVWWYLGTKGFAPKHRSHILREERPQTLLVKDADSLQKFSVTVPMAEIRSLAAEKDE